MDAVTGGFVQATVHECLQKWKPLKGTMSVGSSWSLKWLFDEPVVQLSADTGFNLLQGKQQEPVNKARLWADSCADRKD